MYSIHNRHDLEKLKNYKKQIFTTQRKIKRETREAKPSLRYGRSF